TGGGGIEEGKGGRGSGRGGVGSEGSSYDGATVLGTATANGSGAWTFTTGTLADATHSLTARASDAAGNMGAASTALSVTIDTVRPEERTVGSDSTGSGTVGAGIRKRNTHGQHGTA